MASRQKPDVVSVWVGRAKGESGGETEWDGASLGLTAYFPRKIVR